MQRIGLVSIRAAWAVLLFQVLPQSAFAINLAELFGSDNVDLLGSENTKAFVKTLSLWATHRPYDGAQAMPEGKKLDVGLDIGLIGIPDDFRTALTNLGSSSINTPSIPMGRLHVRMRLGPKSGLGFSALFYQGMYFAGADVKIVALEQEEGPVWALRLAATRAVVRVLDGWILEPSVVVSRRLNFADPYLGVGLQYAIGKLVVSTTQSGLTLTSTSSANVLTGHAFLGTGFNIAVLRLTMEGSYSFGGNHTLGLKVGMRL